MTQAEIKIKKEEALAELKEHDAKRKLIEAKLVYIQHICSHPKATSYNDGGSYGGPSFASTYYNCPDCGYQSVT